MKKPTSLPRYGGSINIQDWMVRLYGLQESSLLIYATIHSFSRNGNGVFRGSLQYLSFWSGKSRPTIIKILKELQSQNLIEKHEVHYTKLNPSKHYCEYWTSFSRLSAEEQERLIKSSKKVFNNFSTSC